MDFDDAETALRAAVRGFHGWTFEQFLDAPLGPAEVRGDSGELYLFSREALDVSGDYDPKEELLELEFWVHERAPAARFPAQVRASAGLHRGDTFDGEVSEITRVTAEEQERYHRRARIVLVGAGLALLAALLRCVH
jgi:hypothetical protein